MRHVAHWFYLLAATFRLSAHFAQAFFYWKTRARADLHLPETLKKCSASEIKRRRHYFFGTTFLSAVFCQLRGQKLNPAERRRFSRLAALACAFDDAADQLRRPTRHTPEELGNRLDDGGLALHLLNLVYAEVPDDALPAFQTNLNQVFHLELSGRQTGSPRPSEDELAAIAKQKGGYSVLLFRRLLDAPPTAAEEALAIEFGGFVQLCDDIFDVWFDRQKKIATLAVELLEQNRLEQLQTHFARQVDTLTRSIRQAPGTPFRRETALRMVHFLSSITRVCLRQYAKLEKKRGTLPLDNRLALVVDMGLLKNWWRAACALLIWNFKK